MSFPLKVYKLQPSTYKSERRRRVKRRRTKGRSCGCCWGEPQWRETRRGYTQKGNKEEEEKKIGARWPLCAVDSIVYKGSARTAPTNARPVSAENKRLNHIRFLLTAVLCMELLWMDFDGLFSSSSSSFTTKLYFTLRALLSLFWEREAENVDQDHLTSPFPESMHMQQPAPPSWLKGGNVSI